MYSQNEIAVAKPTRFISVTDLLGGVAFTLLLLLFQGYYFGGNDQIELLPYVKYLANPTLYSHDFFIQSLAFSTPNERTIMANILLPFAAHLPWVIFLLHIFTIFFWSIALYKIALYFIQNEWMAWGAVYLSAFLLNDMTLGNVDFFTGTLQASDIACMLLSWSMLFFLYKKNIAAIILIILASFIHVLEGLDFMLVMGMTIVAIHIFDRKIKLRTVMIMFGSYFFTAGIYQLLLYKAKSTGQSQLDSHTLFEILIVFRHAHHFIFSAFPLSKIAVSVFAAAIAWWYYYPRDKRIWYFVVFGTLLIAYYAMAVDVFHCQFITNFQLYKIAPWIKFFGCIAIVSVVFDWSKKWIQWQPYIPALGYGIVIVFSCLYLVFFAKNNRFQFPFFAKTVQQSFYETVKAKTPVGAVFIIPFDDTFFKYHSERSSYIDFKAIAKHQVFIGEWHNRVKKIYGVSIADSEHGFALLPKAKANYKKLIASSDVAKLKADNIQYIIADNTVANDSLELIVDGGGKWLYQIK